MKAALLVAAVLLLTTTLAGCADEPQTIVVSSNDDDLAVGPVAETEPEGSGEGHIAGFVVDEAFRVLPGVRVMLPTFDLNDTTDRNGEFAFVDLAPGSYYLEVNHSGYRPVRTVLDVPKDEFVRVKVVLQALPPPEPHHVTWEFEGYVPWTNTAAGTLQTYDSFTIETTEPGLHTLLVEVFMSAHDAGGTNGFRYRIGPPGCCDHYVAGEGPNHLRVTFPVAGTEHVEEAYRLQLMPFGFPTPEVDKAFEVFITAFYNGPPPEGWTIAAA